MFTASDFLPLFQASPVDALTLIGDRPTVVVRSATDEIDSDDPGPELGECQAVEGSSDEAGNLDDTESRQRAGGGVLGRHDGPKLVGHAIRAVNRQSSTGVSVAVLLWEKTSDRSSTAVPCSRGIALSTWSSLVSVSPSWTGPV